jgi:hypothetical protein
MAAAFTSLAYSPFTLTSPYAQRDPRSQKHWVANDFTIDEIKRLDSGKWFKPEFAGEKIVTFQELIDLVRGKAGVYQTRRRGMRSCAR